MAIYTLDTHEAASRETVSDPLGMISSADHLEHFLDLREGSSLDALITKFDTYMRERPVAHLALQESGVVVLTSSESPHNEKIRSLLFPSEVEKKRIRQKSNETAIARTVISLVETDSGELYGETHDTFFFSPSGRKIVSEQRIFDGSDQDRIELATLALEQALQPEEV